MHCYLGKGVLRGNRIFSRQSDVATSAARLRLHTYRTPRTAGIGQTATKRGCAGGKRWRKAMEAQIFRLRLTRPFSVNLSLGAIATHQLK